MTKIIILSDDTIIDNKIRVKGEFVTVPDGWLENVLREVKRLDPEAKKAKLEKLKKDKKDKEIKAKKI